jgi:hypothetical protein
MVLDQKARRAAGRVADHFGGLGVEQFDHELDDVARRAELAVDAGGAELAQHVFVEIALDVAVAQRQQVDLVTAETSRLALGIRQVASFMYSPKVVFLPPRSRRCGNTWSRTWRSISRRRIRSSSSSAGSAGRGRILVRRFAGAAGQLLEAGFVDVQQAREHQEGNLLDNGERVGDAAGPEFRPERSISFLS